MITKIIKIGNSRGIRLPKIILRQMGIDAEVDRDRIILKPIHHRGNGWREAFRKMATESDVISYAIINSFFLYYLNRL